jgi:hypothetical protein
MANKGLMPGLKMTLNELEKHPISPDQHDYYNYAVAKTHVILDAAGVNDTDLPAGIPLEAQVLFAGFMSGLTFATQMFKTPELASATAESFQTNPMIFVSNMADVLAKAIQQRYNGERQPQLVVLPKDLFDTMQALGFSPADFGCESEPKGKAQAAPQKTPTLDDLEKLFSLKDDRPKN